jgi:hypothetical protein
MSSSTSLIEFEPSWGAYLFSSFNTTNTCGDDPLERLLVAKGDAIEETQRACDLVDMRPRILLDDKMRLVGTDLPCRAGERL